MTARTIEHWKDSAAISVAAAAVVFDRSQSWIRDRVDDGSLTADRGGRIILITTESVERLARRLATRATPNASAKATVGRLWLIVDNT